MCCLSNRSNWFYEQALAPKEKDSMDSIGSEVDDEINATAEVRVGYNDIFFCFILFLCVCVCSSSLLRMLLVVFLITCHCTFKHTGSFRILKRL